jgi:hypothetical protein
LRCCGVMNVQYLFVTYRQHAGDESINDPLPVDEPSPVLAAANEAARVPPGFGSAVPAFPSSASFSANLSFSVPFPVASIPLQNPSSSEGAEAQEPVSSESAGRDEGRPYVPASPVYAPSPFSGGTTTAANRTEFVILFGASLPDVVDSVDRLLKLRWSVQTVSSHMDSPSHPSLSRTEVVSELLAVKLDTVRECMPLKLANMMSSYGDEIPPFMIAHSLKRRQILSWYKSVADLIGTMEIFPKIICPSKKPCQVTTFTGGKSSCSVCSQMIYYGSSVARSVMTDFCVCETCCRDPKVRSRLVETEPETSSFSDALFSSNDVSALLELILEPRSFLPAADNFAADSWHIAMDAWARLLHDTVPSSSCNSSRPRQLIGLNGRVSNFRRRVPEPQFYFRVSGLDQANVCDAMKQIFEFRAKINLKLADARQASVEQSKLTVLFRHSDRAGQAAGMPANIHSDGITPVMYSILALEFSNPKKFATGMWLPTCFIDGDVAPCGLFPRPFIPTSSPLECQRQEGIVEQFLLLGRCIGIALRDRRVFMLPISLAFADSLCGKHLSLWDACLGEIDLQEDDGLSANRSVLHAIEHCLDYSSCFSMVYRGQTLSNERIDVPISASSFDLRGHCSLTGVDVSIAADGQDGMSVDASPEVVQHVLEVGSDGDPVYVIFSGQLPLGLSSLRAYTLNVVKDAEASRLRIVMDAASCNTLAENQRFSVQMHVLRVYSSKDACGDEYLKALEVVVDLSRHNF